MRVNLDVFYCHAKSTTGSLVQPLIKPGKESVCVCVCVCMKLSLMDLEQCMYLNVSALTAIKEKS